MISAVPESINAGDMLSFEVAMHLGGLEADDIVVECVKGKADGESGFNVTETVLLYLAGTNPEGDSIYRCDLFESGDSCLASGLQEFKIRYYPCHHLLSHPFECGLMRWL